LAAGQQHLPRVEFRWFWSTRIATELPIGKPLQTEEAQAIASGQPEMSPAGIGCRPARKVTTECKESIEPRKQLTGVSLLPGFLNLMFDTETQEGVS
jgi:hypothetical protein